MRVDLNVRGICCLRPGVPGLSENIRVVSVVGRFLEHSRVYAFERDGERKVYISSADLMPRNLDNRVELAVPIEDPALRAEVLETVELCLADNHNAWDLDADGVWTRRRPPSRERDDQRAGGADAPPHARGRGLAGRGRPAAHASPGRRPQRRGACRRRQPGSPARRGHFFFFAASGGPGSTIVGGLLPSRVSAPYWSPLQPHGRPRS